MTAFEQGEEYELLYMFLHPTEMHIQLMQMLQQRSKRRAFRHLGKGVHVLGEALATIAELAVGAGDIGVGIVDVAGEEDASMHFTPRRIAQINLTRILRLQRSALD